MKLLKDLIPGIEVVELDWFHFRIMGKVTIDYWPSRDRVWYTGTSSNSFLTTPQRIAEMVL